MNVYLGNGKTEYGTGVQIDLTGDEVAIAIDAYLTAHRIHVSGARTIRVNGDLCKEGSIYVDPSGFVIADGDKYSGDSRVKTDEALLEENGWTVECESPFEIRHIDGSFATLSAAQLILESLYELT